MKKIIIILASVLIVLSVAIYAGVDYFGQKAFDTLIDSASTVNIDSSIVPKIEEVQATPEPSKTEEVQQNGAEQKPVEEAQKTPAPVKKEVSIEDKAQAINLLKSKFSAGEIAEIQGKVARGLSSQEIADIKKMVKSRLSAEEIAKLREWYAKYK